MFFDSYNRIEVKHNDESKNQNLNAELDGIVSSIVNENEMFKKNECTVQED